MILIGKKIIEGNVSLIYSLDETDKGILQALSDNQSIKQVAYKLNLTIPQLNARLRVMKERYDCNTLPGLVSKLLNFQK